MRQSFMRDADAGATDAATRAKPSGIWTFIALDCASFGLFFFVFMVERLNSTALFDRSARTLDVRLGLINTCILITSSWLVALAGAAAERGEHRRCGRLIIAGLAVATLFGCVKMFEYVEKVHSGISVLTNEFYTFYFALTGVHLFHYLIGLIVLAVIARQASAAAHGDGDQRLGTWIEAGSLYWHMVDLLWVFLFTMLYLLGAR